MNLNLDTMQTLIFIDSTVTDYQSLIAGAVPNSKVIILNGGEDGVAQITSALKQHPQISNLHVVSHGSPGCLYLGNSQLSLQTLDYYADELKSWFTSRPGVKSLQRQLFIYGCSVAAGDAGEELIQKLHRLTGAEIAASAKPTGNASLGGDWNLEVTTVAMTPELAFSTEVQAAYAGVFAPPVNDNFADRTVIAGIDATNLTTTVSGTNVEATGEPGEQPIITDSGIPDPVINSAWWSWTAPVGVDGILTIDTFGSALNDTLLGVYFDTTLDSLTPLAFNDNTSQTVSLDQSFQSQLTIDVVGGTEYFIAVDGFDSETGDITLNLDFSETVAPTITLPSNNVFNATTDPNSAQATVNLATSITISDNFTQEADLVVTNSYNGGGIDASGAYDIGTTEVIYTVTDLSGNVTQATLSVVVTDDEAPNISTQDIDVFLDEDGFASITPQQIDDGTTDNSGNPVDLSLDITEFTPANLANSGANTVTLTATDPSGNSSSDTATVTVIDNIAPIAIAQNFDLILDASGNGTISVADIDAGSSDNSEQFTTALDVTDFAIADVGPNTVTLTVTDSSGNSTNATATVDVIDNIAPVIILQDNITVQLNDAGVGTLTVGDVDNGSTDAANLLPIELSQTDFTVEDVGPNDVTITVTDVNGNVATEVATVTVVDSVIPNPVAQDITVQLDENGEYVLTPEQIDNGSTDAAGIASLQLFKGTTPVTAADTLTFDGTELGPQTVTLVVTDVNGNEATTTATVTVEDTLAPVITAPNDIFVNTDPGVPIAQVTVPSLVVTDNVDAAPTIVNDFTGTPNASGNYNIGETVVTYTVTDAEGNSDTASFTVTVVDNEAPVLTTPFTDITVNTDPGENFATIDNLTPGFIAVPTFTDNDGQTPTVVNDITGTTDASEQYDIGETVVTYTATDTAGNEATVSYTITVVDAEAPTITPLANITVDNEPGLDGAQVGITIPTADDNSAVVSLVNDYTDELDASGFFPLGTTDVIYTATDDSGNQSTELVRVLVRDVENPTLIGVPADTTSPFGVIPSIPDVDAQDNSGFADVTLTEDNQGDVLIRTWTATDGSANEISETQIITFFEPIELGSEAGETVDGSADDDFLLSLDGNDTVNGNGGNDVIYGGQGNDLMNGGAGNDVIYAGAGIDNLTGGVGADIFVIARDNFADAITDFERGTDKIALTNGLRFGQLAITDDGTDTQIRIAASGRTIAVVSNTVGLDDTDFIDATGGSMGGNSFIVGNDNDNILVGGDGNDAIRGREGDDNLIGNAGIDLVLGHGGNDNLDGGAGNDYIRGGRGFDDLTGGSESDLFVLELSSGTDTILDFEVGIDLITVIGVSVNQLSTVQTNDDLNVFASGQLLATILNVDASQVGAESFISF